MVARYSPTFIGLAVCMSSDMKHYRHCVLLSCTNTRNLITWLLSLFADCSAFFFPSRAIESGADDHTLE